MISALVFQRAVAKDASATCTEYKSYGWCDPENKYFREIINDCQYTCNDCEPVV